jgi:dephospho-CoA kinase
VTEKRALSVPPLTILLLGGVASGKSTVAELLVKRGAVLLDADRMAHAVLEQADVAAQVAEAFGAGVKDDHGRVDRKRLAEVVFRDPAKLKKLEALVHPHVIASILTRLSELAQPAGRERKVAILDVPLAGEAGLMESVDLRVFVEASEETRRRRARENRSWSPGELERREARQLPIAEKRAKADVVVRNDGDVAEAEQDVERFWTSVVRPRVQAVSR